MMGLHEHYDDRPQTMEEAYKKLHLEDVLDAARFVKWGITPGSGKRVYQANHACSLYGI